MLFALLGILLLYSAIKTYIVRKQSYFIIIIPVLILGIVFGLYYIVQYQRVSSYIKEHFPPDLAWVENGEFLGAGSGLRGPIHVAVNVEDGKIQAIDILQHQEMISALDGLADQVIKANRLDIDFVPPTIHGSIETMEGFREAVSMAVLSGMPEHPEFNAVTNVMHYFSRFQFDMTTLNALAILFCIVLVFDYTLQPALIQGTGQALNCYNCQTCVGACPVKIVDGEPYPMTMVLATRLGDYEKVKRLAKYCVACSRCAGKCPVGDSGPSIAAAAISFVRQRERAKKMV
ncbi:MAG: 4Fe-4S dicluster domain-containing protein [Candidatus Zhuqueibacterota bacterium]